MMSETGENVAERHSQPPTRNITKKLLNISQKRVDTHRTP
jgi:hypothetical protein